MKMLISIALFALLSGCAGVGDTWVPMIDQRGPDQSKTYADLAECQGYASQSIGPEGGAVVGSAIGGLLMAAFAPPGYRSEWALSGMAIGAVGGAAGGIDDQKSIIRRCMLGRGYSVLD